MICPFSQMKLPRAILFDHDGVLVASEPLHWAAWAELCRELGLTYDDALIRSMVGKTAPEIITTVLNKHRPGWSPAELDPHALARRKNDFYLASAATGLRAYPGVLEGLQWLRSAGVRAAVVSNAKKRELEAALVQLGLMPWFDLVLSRDDIQPPKPDPAPYLFGAASLGVDVEDAIAVEDSPPGLEAALMARIPTAAVMTNFPREVLEAPVPGRPDLRPVWVGASMVEFFAWLRGMERS